MVLERVQRVLVLQKLWAWERKPVAMPEKAAHSEVRQVAAAQVADGSVVEEDGLVADRSRAVGSMLVGL